MKKPTKQAIRAVASLARDRNERELFRHEIRALSELVKLGWVRFVNECTEITKRGIREARKNNPQPKDK